ncbi:MAG: hypothetical protein ACRC1Z_10250 [Waterburya sp.]
MEKRLGEIIELPQIEFEPSEDLVNCYALWLAKKVIKDLQARQEVKSDVGEIAQELKRKFDIFSECADNINLDIKAFLAQMPAAASPTQKIIDGFLEQALARELQKTERKLRCETREYFRKTLSNDFQEASPQNLIKFFKDLGQFLLFQKNDFEQQKINWLETENLACPAFFKLKDIQVSEQEQEIIWNALQVTLKNRLNVEILQILTRTLLNLIQICQDYCASTISSLRLLKAIESSLSEKCSDSHNFQLISLPIASNLEQELAKQRPRLEIDLGHSLNSWGSDSVPWQLVEKKLLDNLKPTAKILLLEIYTFFTEHYNRI